MLSLVMLTGCRSDAESAASCRKQFASYERALASTGNPGHKDFTPKMAARRDALDATVRRLATSATGHDCPDRLAATKRDMSQLDAVLRKIDDYNVARMLAGAEHRLQTDQRLHAAYARDYVLISLVQTLRSSAKDAERSLRPDVERVDAAKAGDTAERDAAMIALYNSAAANAAFANFTDALQSIRGYKPPES